MISHGFVAAVIILAGALVMFLGKEFNVELISSALLLASMQFSIASVEMSSTFSVKNFSKDPATLRNAVHALAEYLSVAVFWMLIVSLYLFYGHGVKGLVLGLFFNLVFITWLYVQYHNAFEEACNVHRLEPYHIWMCWVNAPPQCSTSTCGY